MTYYNHQIRDLYEKYNNPRGQYVVLLFDTETASTYQCNVTRGKMASLANEYFDIHGVTQHIMVTHQRRPKNDIDRRIYLCKNNSDVHMYIVGNKDAAASTQAVLKSLEHGNPDFAKTAQVFAFDTGHYPDFHQDFLEYMDCLIAMRHGDCRLCDMFTAYRKFCHNIKIFTDHNK